MYQVLSTFAWTSKLDFWRTWSNIVDDFVALRVRTENSCEKRIFSITYNYGKDVAVCACKSTFLSPNTKQANKIVLRVQNKVSKPFKDIIS